MGAFIGGRLSKQVFKKKYTLLASSESSKEKYKNLIKIQFLQKIITSLISLQRYGVIEYLWIFNGSRCNQFFSHRLYSNCLKRNWNQNHFMKKSHLWNFFSSFLLTDSIYWTVSFFLFFSSVCLSLPLCLSLSPCHGFLLAVMHNHRGLEQYQACENLSLPFNDKTSLEMRTWCIHNRGIERYDEMGILSDSFGSIRSSYPQHSKTTTKEKRIN